MAGDTDNSSPSPNKRRKTLKSEIGPEANPIQSTPQEPETSNSPQSCAVCYLDDDKAVRGKIDCCDHYFCFLCILEWSKTESRCPLCRRRFATIYRPSKAGVFVRSRTVKVPVRDQVRNPFGNTNGDVQSYEQVMCSVCHLSTDDSLLMLCDDCDAAAHTYCVGLGRTVPEGDWFCDNCAPSHQLHDNPDTDNEDVTVPPRGMPRISSVRNQSSDFPSPAVPGRFGSVMDEVTTPATAVPSVGNRQAESVANQSSSSTSDAVSRRMSILMNGVTRQARTLTSVETRPTESVARTLDRCRNVQSRIQTLRENWNGFRSGSLSFPSSSVKSACGSSQRHNNGVVIHERSDQTQSSSSTSGQQVENRESASSIDIDKAWKMMEKSRRLAQEKSSSVVQLSKRPSCIASAPKKQTGVDSCFGISSQAQSLYSTSQPRTNQVGCASHDFDRVGNIMDTMSKQQIHTKPTSSVQQPKLLSRNASASKETTNVNSSFDVSKSERLGTWDQSRPGREAYNSRGKESTSYCSAKLEKERQCRVTALGAVESSEGLPTANSKGECESQCSWRNLNKASENVTPEQSGSACIIRIAKPDLNASSSSNSHLEKRNVQRATGCMESKAGKLDELKIQIISLVKTNLKLLSKDKRLGVDAFKEIARRSTHTILAACDLEHRKPGLPAFPSLECCHTEQLHPPHKSSPMPNSCQACFSGFVKDVVSSILLGSAKLN